MMRLLTLYIGVALIVVLGAAYFSYQTIFINVERQITTEVQAINAQNSNWTEVFQRLSQFYGNELLGGAEGKGENADNTEQNDVDPNDISKAKLIGILLEQPASVIIQLPKQANVTDNIGRTIKVKQGEQVLDGWQLNVIDQTTIEWRHLKINTLVQQRLFENTDTNISESK